jgi:membrane-associated protein
MSEFINWIKDWKENLRELMTAGNGMWAYGVLFAIIFAETGLVIMPFLPGDSLLFLAGAIVRDVEASNDIPADQKISMLWLCLTLIVAAILGDTVNYHVGYFFGPRVFKNPKSFWLNPSHLEKTQQFFEKYGGKAIILARFVPIVRTFAPFVAGIGNMNYSRFLAYNVIGGVVWVLLCLYAGYWFGGMPFVQKNFELVLVMIIAISLLPPAYEYWQHRRGLKNAA